MGTNPHDSSPDELERRLQEYHAAIRSEFDAAVAAAADTAELEKQIRSFYKDNCASAAVRIVWLSQNSASDAIQFAACKFVQEQGLLAAKADQEDPYAMLLKELHSKQPTLSSTKPAKPKSAKQLALELTDKRREAAKQDELP